MQKLIGILMCGGLSAVTGCADSNTMGSDFHCTGTWPHPWTPCDSPFPSRAATYSSTDGYFVELLLHRVVTEGPVPIEGGGSVVYIDIPVGPALDALTGAREVTTDSSGTGRVIETSTATSVLLEPIVTSATGDREAGRFSVSFAWGSIFGTYDTEP
jgi:hypothetical protein